VSENSSDSYFGGNSDCSLELAILEYGTSPEKMKSYQNEKVMVEYLK